MRYEMSQKANDGVLIITVDRDRWIEKESPGHEYDGKTQERDDGFGVVADTKSDEGPEVKVDIKNDENEREVHEGAANDEEPGAGVTVRWIRYYEN